MSTKVTIAASVCTLVCTTALLAAVSTSTACGAAHAAQSDELTARVDQLFAQWNRSDSPGCALAVIRDGLIVYQRGYGMADLENDVPITPESVFYIASMSKQFTAFAVALLAKDGRLSLDDDLRKYVPELPRYEVPITVRHLVHHTGGLREYSDLLALAGRRWDDAKDNDEIVEIMARQKAPSFNAGDEFVYSNTGYALLASIVERASGTSFSAYTEAHIFRPLGMTDTHVHDDLTRLIKRRAYGYAPRPHGGYILATPTVALVGVAGVFTTVRDLAKWDQNFYDGRVGGLALIQQVQQTGTLNQGQPVEYASGLFVVNRGGLRIVEHGGDLGGYRAWLRRVPERRFSVACLCNQSDILQGNLTTFVTNIYLATGGPTTGAVIARRDGGAPSNPSSLAQPQSITLTTSQLAEYAGEYYSDELDATYTLSASEGKLLYKVRRASPTTLVPIGTDAFNAGNARFNFTRDGGNRISGFTLDAGRIRNLQFVKRR